MPFSESHRVPAGVFDSFVPPQSAATVLIQAVQHLHPQTIPGHPVWCWLTVLLTVLAPISVLGAEVPIYQWQRELDLPDLMATTCVAVPLDSHFFEFTRDGHPDVRLHDDQGLPIGFLIQSIRQAKTHSLRSYWTAEQTAAKVDSRIGLQLEFTLREKEPTPQGIRIITPLHDFEHQVRLESSSDGTTWKAVGFPAVIFDYSRHVDARNDLVPIVATADRQFRLTIEAITAEQESLLLELNRKLNGGAEIDRTERTTIARRPFRIERIEFYQDQTRIEGGLNQLNVYPIKEFRQTENTKDHQTILLFGSQREPISEVKILTTADNFSRSATMEVEQVGTNDEPRWNKLATGALTRFSIGLLHKEELTLLVGETRATRYRIVIENRDSPPLPITGVEVSGPAYELTFLAGPNERLQLEYGSATALAGQFDTAALQAVLRLGQAPVIASLKTPVANPQAPADGGRGWRPWNDSRVLLTTIVAATLLLGWGLFRASQQLQSPGQP